MRKPFGVMFGAVLIGTALVGCRSIDPPCEQLPKPTQVEVQASREGAEVEREVQGAECVVVGDSWVDQTDE